MRSRRPRQHDLSRRVERPQLALAAQRALAAQVATVGSSSEARPRPKRVPQVRRPRRLGQMQPRAR